MAEINNAFKVKKGLDVTGDAAMHGNASVDGYITTPTPAPTENSTKVATTAFVLTAINSLINGAPGALDTLNELATALGNDPNFATTITNQLALKAPLASPALTGTPTAPTASNGDNSSTIATTAFVKNQAYAPLTSPALVGIPTAPTASVGTNTTQISTTAFVQAALAAYGVGSTATAIPGGTTGSIDSATIPSGIYQVTSSNTGTKPSGDTSGFLIVMQGTGSTLVHQMYYDDTTARMFSRAYASSAWTAWREAAYLDSPAFTGTPTAPTPAQFDNTTKIATTAFVKTTQGNSAGVANFNTNTALSLFYLGYEVQWFGPSGGIFTLPTASTIPSGYGYNIYNQGSGTLIVQVAGGSDFIWSGASLTSITLQKGDNIVLTGRGSNEIDITGGTASLQYVQSPSLVSPVISGVPTAPTAAPGTNSTQLATTAYADAIAALKANVANPAFTGAATFGGSVSSADLVSFPFVNGGSYVTSTSSVTGSLKIKLPAGYTSTTVSFDVDVFEGNPDISFKLRIVGYLTLSSWASQTITQIGGVASRLPNVRFGNDGTSACVWIGELTDTWSFPNINISNVHLGYAAPTSVWQNPWGISYVTTFDTIKAGPIAANKTAFLNSPAFTGRVTIGTSDDGSNALQVNGSIRGANYFINSQGTGDAGLIGFANTNGPAIGFYGTGTTGAGALVFRSGNVEKARLSPGGRFLIGTTVDDASNIFQVAGDAALNGGIFRSLRFGNFGALVMNRAEGSFGSPTAVVSNQIIGGLISRGYDGGTYRDVSSINMLSNGAITGSDSSGYMTFNTTPTGSVATTERMRLVSAGRLLINTTTDDGGNVLQVNGGIKGMSGVGALLASNGGGAGQTTIVIKREGGPTDQKSWELMQGGDGTFALRTINDAYSNAQNAIWITRGSGVNVGTMVLMQNGGRVLMGTLTDDGSSMLQINGIATATTPTVGDISTKVATTSFTQQTADNSAIVYSIVFG